MHDCQRFREEILGLTGKRPPEDLSPDCAPCRQYALEAAALFAQLETLRSDVPDPSADYWAGFNNRLKQTLIEEASACTHFSDRWRGPFAIVLASTALLVIAVSAFVWRLGQNVPEPIYAAAGRIEQPAEIRFQDNPLEELDNDTIQFMGRSEMFLRSFTKITPSNIEDIEDARVTAVEQLARLQDRKKVVNGIVPVQIVFDQYANVLREIGSLQPGESIADDLAHIQGKIRQEGLIAGMKTYQPRPEILFTSGR